MNSRILVFTVLAGVAFRVGAGDVEEVLNLSSGIKGVVYVDHNGNDILDQEDTLLRNAEISVVDLKDEEGEIVRSGLSDERGNFKILGIHTGNYRLRVVSKVTDPFLTDAFELVGGEEGLEFKINVLEKKQSLHHFKDRAVEPQNIDADEVSESSPES